MLYLELELDYVSRHALLTAAHWIPGILGFVVLEVLGAGTQAGAGAEFHCPGRVTLDGRLILFITVICVW